MLLADRRPDEPLDLIDFGAEERAIPVEQGDQGPTAADATDPGNAGMLIDDDAPEAGPPEPFEVILGDFPSHCIAYLRFCTSILLIMTRSWRINSIGFCYLSIPESIPRTVIIALKHLQEQKLDVIK